MLKVSMSFSSADSTELMNAMIKDILPKGVYIHPTDWITQVDGLQLQIAKNWVVRSFDGMTIREHDTNQPLTLTTIGDYYVGLYGEYILAKDPNLELLAVPVATYDSWSNAQKAKLIRFAKVLATTVGSAYSIQVYYDYMDVPRSGPLALRTDLLKYASTSSLRVVNNTSQLYSFTPETDEIVWVETYGRFFKTDNNGGWIDPFAPLSGTSTFAGCNGSPAYTAISWPQAVLTWMSDPSNAGKLPQVMIQSTANVGGRLGETWVVKDSNGFKVYNTGSASGSVATFDWQILI